MAKIKRAPMFPIRYVWGSEKLHSASRTPVFISWAEAERAFEEYRRRGTLPIASLDQIAAGGGFSASEMDDLAPGWKERHAGQDDAYDSAAGAAADNNETEVKS